MAVTIGKCVADTMLVNGKQYEMPDVPVSVRVSSTGEVEIVKLEEKEQANENPRSLS